MRAPPVGCRKLRPGSRPARDLRLRRDVLEFRSWLPPSGSEHSFWDGPDPRVPTRVRRRRTKGQISCCEVRCWPSDRPKRRRNALRTAPAIFGQEVDTRASAVHHAPLMALTVVVRSGDLKSQATITFDAPRIVIGRGDGCEIRLPDPSVSHRHASIRQRGTDYVVFDEGSSNGTFVGPVRLSPQAPRVLRSGDLIRLGRVWVEVRIEQVPVTQSQKLVTREIALNLVASALAAQGEASRARVWVQKGP